LSFIEEIGTQKDDFSPFFSPAEVTGYSRSEAMNHNRLCPLLQRRSRHGEIGWPSVYIVQVPSWNEKRS